MKRSDLIPQKIISISQAAKLVAQLRVLGKTIAFTNGVFDILHEGHIFSLSQAAKEADFLIVGLNADESVRRLKGEGRPVNGEDSRALLLASLEVVDAVILFHTDTPIDLITAVMPDVLVKGGDYTIDKIVGAPEVQSHGGRVVINPVLEGFSTSSIIEQIRNH